MASNTYPSPPFPIPTVNLFLLFLARAGLYYSLGSIHSSETQCSDTSHFRALYFVYQQLFFNSKFVKRVGCSTTTTPTTVIARLFSEENIQHVDTFYRGSGWRHEDFQQVSFCVHHLICPFQSFLCWHFFHVNWRFIIWAYFTFLPVFLLNVHLDDTSVSTISRQEPDGSIASIVAVLL